VPQKKHGLVCIYQSLFLRTTAAPIAVRSAIALSATEDLHPASASAVVSPSVVTSAAVVSSMAAVSASVSAVVSSEVVSSSPVTGGTFAFSEVDM
jgi:hypothetical protein